MILILELIDFVASHNGVVGSVFGNFISEIIDEFIRGKIYSCLATPRISEACILVEYVSLISDSTAWSFYNLIQ